MSVDRSLLYCNFVICEDRKWFWSLNFNALFYQEMSSHRMKSVGPAIKNGSDTYNNVILYEKKLIIMPGRARKIMIYDITVSIFRFIEVKIPEVREDSNLFYGYVVADDYLFMIGNQYPCILKFNMRTEKIEKIVNLFPYGEGKVFFREAILDRDKLIIPAFDDALIFEVNIENLQWSSRQIGQFKEGFSSICKDESSIWLLPKDRGPVLQWHRKNNTIVEHKIENAGFRYTPLKPNFHSGIYLDDKVWLIPFYGNCVLTIDIKTGEISKDNTINRYLKTVQLTCGECKFRAGQIVSGNIHLLCSCTGELIIYNPRENKLDVGEKENKLSNSDYLGYLYTQNVQIAKEGDFFIEDLIDFIIY